MFLTGLTVPLGPGPAGLGPGPGPDPGARVPAHASACADPVQAVEEALRQAEEGDIVLVAGSVYLAGAVLDGARRGEIWPRRGPDAKVR